MKFIADLHVHGRYSRACSKDLSIYNLEKYAKIKGVNLLGTGDCLHPLWLNEIKNNLKEDENGILWTKNQFPFILQTEIALMYTQEKGRRIHYIVLIPNIDTLNQIIDDLKKIGRMDYDGRPIFGISSIEFVERMLSISKYIEVIPAHIWTSWYGLLGSKSGFDSIEECFQEKTKYIHAIETGLSSSPAMNWRVKFLDNLAVISFSDLHTYFPWRLGREATVFDLEELTYENLIRSIQRKNISETFEFYPQAGKYHLDGHRNCNIVLTPKESRKYNNICPSCNKELTIGVLHRVEELADRPEGYMPKGAVPFKTMLPLAELLAFVYGCNVTAKKVQEEYNSLLQRFGNEFNVLLDASYEELTKITKERIAAMILRNREGKIKIQPGYDGVYGRPILEEGKESTLARFV